MKAKSTFRMLPKKPVTVFLCNFCTSIVIIISGILIISLWSAIYELIMKSNLVVKPGSTAYEMWVKNPIPLQLKLFVYNWTNPEDVYNSGVKPRFKQMGPYTYTETKEKSNITWNRNGTVTYRHLKKWWFDPGSSSGSIEDLITTISPVALSTAYMARNWHYLSKKIISMALSGTVHQIHVTRPVGEILFTGYEDALLSMAAKLPVPSSFPLMDKFGWFYGRNGSADFEGVYNMDTGSCGQVGELLSYQYSKNTSYYPGTCGRFDRASAGDFFPRDLTKTSVVKMFSSDLCRYMELEFEREVVINGMVGFKYSAMDRFLDNGTKIPENKCFCDGACMPSGALNVSNCRHGSPAFVSLPHFYKADPSYLEAVEGLTPSMATDDFFMVFEPRTGIPLQVSARLQLNLRVASVPDIRMYENLPTFYFPVLYFEQFVTMPESMAFSIKMLINFKTICWSVGFALVCIGICIVACLCFKMCTTNIFGKKKKKQKQIKGMACEEVPLRK